MRLNKTSVGIGISALAVGLLAAGAATSAGAIAGRFGGHCGPGGAPGVGRLEHRLERLDLSADVRAKAFAIIDASRSDERALREQVRAAHEQLRTLLESGAADPAALNAQIDGLGALQTQEHKQFLHALIEIGALLPDAQRAQWFAPLHRGDGPRPH
jgi:protein CpxP